MMRVIVARFFLPLAITASFASYLIARDIGMNLELAVILIGLYASSRYPARSSYWSQIISMISPQCCRAQAGS